MKKTLTAAMLIVLTCSAVANAQQSNPPLPPPPPPPLVPVQVSPPPPDESSTPTPSSRAFPLQEPLSQPGPHPRYSQFSAGPAGLLLMFTNLVFGIGFGALAGVWSNPGGSGNTAADTAPLTGLLGGVLLGAAAAGYQYAVWTNYPRAATSIITLFSGLFLGLGFLQSAGELGRSPNTLDAVILAAVTEAAFFAFLGVTHEANMTAGDAFCTSVGALYGFAIALLVVGYIGSTGNSGTDFTPVLYGPAIGEILGGILAYAYRPTPRTVAFVGLIPLGITAVYMSVLSFSGGRPAYWGAAMGVLVVSAVVTAIFASGVARPNDPAPAGPVIAPPPTPAKTSGIGFDWMPTVTLAPDTVHGHGTIPGIGVLGRF